MEITELHREGREKFTKGMFNELALKYEKDEHIAHWSDHSLNRQMTTFLRVFQELKTDKGKQILDAGCGPGTYSRVLAEMGNNVVGVDFAKPVINRAIEKSKGKNIHYIVSDVYFFPFKDGTFDMAASIGVIQRIANEQSAINEMNRILKNEGILILITMNSLSVKVFLRSLRGKLISVFSRKKHGLDDKTVYYAIYRNPFKVKKTFKDSGFEKIEVKGVYFFPKILKRVELVFEKLGVFKIMDKIPFFLLVSHMFLLKAVKTDKREVETKEYRETND